ncbi:MAG: hypothetical protein ACI83B_002329 [Sediminicola sp.]|jgi:hypothetical protein
MTPPILAMCAIEKNDRTYLDQMHLYYMQTYDLLLIKKKNYLQETPAMFGQATAPILKNPMERKYFGLEVTAG